MAVKSCEWCARPATRERKNRVGVWIALCESQECLTDEWAADDVETAAEVVTQAFAESGLTHAAWLALGWSGQRDIVARYVEALHTMRIGEES